jgi:hypothetical protein
LSSSELECLVSRATAQHQHITYRKDEIDEVVERTKACPSMPRFTAYENSSVCIPALIGMQKGDDYRYPLPSNKISR